MLQVVGERKQIKIFVSSNAKSAVKSFAERFDMTELGVASRVYEWFGGLPLSVQKWITGLTDANEGEGMQRFASELLAALDKAKAGTEGDEVKPKPEYKKTVGRVNPPAEQRASGAPTPAKPSQR